MTLTPSILKGTAEILLLSPIPNIYGVRNVSHKLMSCCIDFCVPHWGVDSWEKGMCMLMEVVSHYLFRVALPPSHCHMNYSNYGNEPLRNFEGLFDSGSMQHYGAREGADSETKAEWQRRSGWGQDHVITAPDFAEGLVPTFAVSQGFRPAL